jgi:HAD superfamily hydrolase (TIGR01509 family)
MQDRVTSFSRVGRAQGAGPHRWPVAAVFDCDGLLLDTASCWHAAYRAGAASVGWPLDEAGLAWLNGASISIAAQRLSARAGERVTDTVLRGALQEAIESHPIALLPGVQRLLDALAPGMPLAVASNGPASVVRTALARAGIDGYFTTIVSAEEAGAPKPRPDVYLSACGLLAVDPSDAVAFEDSALGATAAREAGLLVIAVPSVRAERIDADLKVTRLDSQQVLDLLGVEAKTSAA